MMRLLAIMFACLAGCGGMDEYAYPPSAELDILDSLTVVFVRPDLELWPTRNLMSTYGDSTGPTVCYWEVWEPMLAVREKGVWIMSRQTPEPFYCSESEIYDSLIRAEMATVPIRSNEDIRLYTR